MNTMGQIAAANKANVESFLDLTSKAFAGVENLVNLNLAAMRATLAESSDTDSILLTSKDPQEIAALQSTRQEPETEMAPTYGTRIPDFATSTQSELANAAEAHLHDARERLRAMVESSIANAPTGSEAVVAMVKSAVVSANQAFDLLQHATRQTAQR